jgi:Bacterial sugar transferase
MSLVGPRPLVADEDQLIEGYDRHRLAITPGMTGPWQILGSARIPLHEMIKLDYMYLANCGFTSPSNANFTSRRGGRKVLCHAQARYPSDAKRRTFDVRVTQGKDTKPLHTSLSNFECY